MDETLTDRDQEERLRNFFSENWRWMLAGIVLGVGGLVGWNRYEAHALRKHESAASEYANLLKTLASGSSLANFAYEFNSDGLISKITLTSDTQVSLLQYTYECK